VKESSTSSRLVKGAVWSLAGSVAARLFGIVASIAVARLLGKSGFGEFGVIQSTVAMFQIFAGFGLGLTATKYVAENRNSDPHRVGRVLGISLLGACFTGVLTATALYLSSIWLATNVLVAPQLTDVLRLSSVLLLLGALTGTQTGALVGFEQFRSIARVNLISGAMNCLFVILATIIAGLPGAVIGLIAGTVVTVVLNHLALNAVYGETQIHPSLIDCWKEYSVLWRFSLPAVLSGLLVAPAIWLCNAMLVHRSDGYGEMGILNAANQWRAAILFLPGVVEMIILPVISNLRGEGNWASYKKVLLYNVYFNGAIALAATLFIALFAHIILKGYGAGFESGRWVLVVLCFSAVLAVITNVTAQLLASEDKMWWGMFLNLTWAATLIGSSFLLVQKGALGLALASLIAYGEHFIMSMLLSIYLVNTRRSEIESNAQKANFCEVVQ
jgi:O-antigen/teichoic acid export membrane protein